ncbi:MAG: acyl carrier protein [Clostridia bacterium]|nr:acyl carrier protein [Clostridia bacterium]
MNEIIDILTELHDDVDFTTETGLVENGILNSLDIVAIISEIDDRFDVQIPAEEILPENFDSAEALWALVQRLDEA